MFSHQGIGQTWIFVNKCTNEAMPKAIDEKKKMVSHKP